MKLVMGMSSILLALAAVFAGASGQAQKETTQASAQPVTLTVVDDSQGSPKIQYMRDVIVDYGQRFPNVKIDYQPWENATLLSEGMFTLFAKDAVPPDIYWLRQGYWVNTFLAAGRILDLTPYVNEKDWDGTGKWGEYFNQAITTDGETNMITGIPQFVSMSTIWWYNKAMFTRLGLHEPASWQDFMSLCEKIKSAGYEPIAAGSKYFGNLLNAFSDILQRRVGSKKYNDLFLQRNGAKWTDPDVVQAFKLLDDMIAKEYFSKSTPANEATELEQLFLSGRAVLAQDGAWLLGFYNNSSPEERAQVFPEGIDFFVTPPVPNGVGSPRGYVSAVETMAISKTTKHVREAVDFLKCMTQPKFGDVIVSKYGFFPPWKNVAQRAGTLDIDQMSLKQLRIISEGKDIVTASDVAFGDELAQAYNEAINWIVLRQKTVPQALGDLQGVIAAKQKR